MTSRLWLWSGPSPTAWKCAVVTVNPLAIAAVVPAAPTGAAINIAAPTAVKKRFTYSHPRDVGPTPTAPHHSARNQHRQRPGALSGAAQAPAGFSRWRGSPTADAAPSTRGRHPDHGTPGPCPPPHRPPR